MFKVNVIAVGKVKEKYFKDAIDEYSKRLSRFCKFSLFEVKEENFVAEPSDSEKNRIMELEGEEIIKRLSGFCIAMCIEGKKIDSIKLGEIIKDTISNGEELTFVIGGSYGLSQRVKNSVQAKISFSDMTFPHTLFRVMLTEQIYRGFMINASSDYHK